MCRRIDGLQAVCQGLAERLRNLGDELGALVAIEDVLNERPLQRVPRAVALWFDAVAAVGAAQEQGD